MVVYRRIPPELEISKVNITTTTNDIQNNETEKKVTPINQVAPHAVLMCRPNSHPFQERHLVLDQPVKVGRSVARCRPGTTNAIFDCKVLSRNHALLWYEKGKFFLKDTKSSNGTFINNLRLSKGSEESPPREVCSGDIVQFGVDVVENTRKGETIVTHGCIIATLKLFLPDGKEAKASPTTAVINTSGSVITSQDLYQLSQFLQEALHREQILENKLAMLQRVVNSTFEASNTNWKALIDEDRLISRIENLESQLLTASKNISEEKLQDEIEKLIEEKVRYQNTAKESLRKLLQEKLEVVRKIQDFESSIENNTEECEHLREVYENSQKELQLLASKTDDYLKEINTLTQKLQEADEREQQAIKSNEAKLELEEQLSEIKEKELLLVAKIEALQADRDFANNQLKCLKAHYDQSHQENIEKDEKSLCREESEEDQELKLDELKTLISDESSESLLNIMYKENGKENHEKENSKDEINDLDKHNVFTELKVEMEQLKVKNEDCDIVLHHMACTIILLKELLEETRAKKCVLESEIVRLKNDLEGSQNNFKKCENKFENLERDLEKAQKESELKEKEVQGLQDKMKFLEGSQPENVNARSQQALTEECASLKCRINSVEAEAQRYRIENQKLLSQYKLAQDTCADLELMKANLEAKGDGYWKDELSLTKVKIALIEKELAEAREELFTLKEGYAECNEKKAHLQKELKIVNEEMQLIAYQTKTVSACSVIPLILLCLAILLAVCPYLSYFTATSDATETT